MAQRAVAALEAAGVPCWIAPRDIDAGENYTQAILEALDAARAIVLVFSSATNESPHVARELETAVSSGRPIIPVRLEQVEPSPSLRYFIGTSQWLDVGGAGDDWSPTLVRAVRRAIGQDTGQTPVVQATVPSAPAATRTGGHRAVLVGAGLVAAVAVAVALAIVLTGDDDPKDTAVDDPSGPDQSIAPRSASAQPSTQGTTPESETQQPSPSQVTSAISDSGNAGPVTCWDASSAPAADQCPLPAGREGMITVFPDLTQACAEVASPIEGKAEVYECRHDGFIVRFTRWDEGFDKLAYYEVENRVESEPWEVGGEPAGLQWFSIEADPAETDPYQWSAAYESLPFSLSVEGESSADRSSGVSELKLVPPSRVGLAP